MKSIKNNWGMTYRFDKTIQKILFTIAVFVFGIAILNSTPVKAATVTIQFRSNSGATNSYYKSISQKVKAGSSIRLPALPKVKNYESVGWDLQKNSSTGKYKAGITVKVNKNITLYAVYKLHPYQTAFFDETGNQNDTFVSLNRYFPKNGILKFPAVPKKSGYTAMGWATEADGSVKYKAGTSVRITSSKKFYAVYQKSSYYSVNFFDQDGTYSNEYLALNRRVEKNGSFLLPAVKDKAGYTFLGWSTSHGKSIAPNYRAGASLKVSRNLSLYAVWFKNRSERQIRKSDLARLNTSKYTRAIFVGDSRTIRQKKVLEYEFGSSSHANITYVALGGSNLNWLKTTGHKRLIENLKKYGRGTSQKPIAIVFNHGVNDLSNINQYISYMKSLEKELRPYNCKLFYMSVNPINSAVIAGRHGFPRTEKQVLDFNAKIKSNLSGTYTYLDSTVSF